MLTYDEFNTQAEQKGGLYELVTGCYLLEEDVPPGVHEVIEKVHLAFAELRARLSDWESIERASARLKLPTR